MAKATYYATIMNGKLAGVSYSYPPKELAPEDFELTHKQYEVLRVADLEDLAEIIKLVSEKLEAK